jgi:putative aldouronate transport system substrate-binding protein
MKKILIVTIVVLMIVMQFTACSVNNTTSGSSDTNAKTTESEVNSNFNEIGYPIVNEPVVYRAMNAVSTDGANWSSGEEGQSFWRAMKELTNIDFKFTNIPLTDWETKLNLSLAASDIPHVYMGGVGDINIATYGVKGGMFVDISKGIYEYMPNLQEWFKKKPLTEKCIYENNGAVYTFPSICLTATNAACSLYYREDFMNDAGVYEEPKTIEEFYTMVKAIAEAHADDPEFSAILPYSADHFNNHFERTILAGLGDYTTAEFHDDGTGKVFYNGTTEQFYRYLEFAHKLYEEKILNNEFYTLDTATTTALTKSNKAAVLTYGTMLLPENFKDGDFKLSLFTPFTSKYTSEKKILGRAGITRSTIVLTSECNEEDVKSLLRWFDIIYSEKDVVPGLNSVSNWLGVRGETWDYVDDTHSKYKMLIPDNWGLSTTEFNYIKAGPSNLYAFEFMPIVDGASPGLKVKGEQSIKKLYPYEVSPFPLSYLSFTSEENDVYSAAYTDILTHVKQMKAKFITGAEPLSNFEQYCATLEKMGLSKVTEVVQAAYDRFNK